MEHRSVVKTVLILLAAVALPALLVIAVPGIRKPQQKICVIGYVNPNRPGKKGGDGFLSGMKKLGYNEGRNVTYIRCETGDKRGIENALGKMAAEKVDLIVTVTTPAAEMAKRIAGQDGIPVVFVMYDAVRSKIVKSLIDHGGNITGVQLSGSTAKALEWLIAIRPGTRHIWVPVCFDTDAARQSLEDLQEAAVQLGVRTTVAKVKTDKELRDALHSMPKDTDAIFLIHSWLVGCNIRTVLDRAGLLKIPVVSAGYPRVDDGVVLSYGPRYDSTGPQAARLADRILHGIPAANLPVEMSDFYLGINLKTAGRIGLEIPDDILQQADFIIREQVKR